MFGLKHQKTDPVKISLLAPVLNEIVGLKAVMPALCSDWFHQIIILDGGSTDGSAEWAREQGFTVYVQKEKGLRQAYREVWPLIEGDVVLTFSPDGNCLPNAIPQMLEKIKEGYDMVIASRYLGDAKSDDDDLLTGFGNWWFTRTVNVLHHGCYTDVMGCYRIYKTRLFYDLDLDKDSGYTACEKLFGTRVGVEPLLSVRAAKRRLRIAEIGADEPARIGGERKLQIWRWGAAYYFQFLREVFCWR